MTIPEEALIPGAKATALAIERKRDVLYQQGRYTESAEHEQARRIVQIYVDYLIETIAHERGG